MRKLLFLLVLLLLTVWLFGSAAISFVNMEDHGGAVCRVVIGLDGNSEAEATQNGNRLEVLVKDWLPGTAAIANSPSGLLSSVEQHGNSIFIIAKRAFRYEQLSLGNRLAYDIFVTDPDKRQRLAIAGFYAETGKLNSADRAYGELHTDYREDGEILYKWALLLQKRGSQRATDKLLLIPKASPFYAKGQALLATLHADEEPLPPPEPVAPPAPQSRITPPMPQSADTLTKAPEPMPQAVPASQPQRSYGFLPLLIILGAAILVIIVVFSLSRHRKRPDRSLSTTEFETSDTALDSKTMCRIVSKLIADGWTTREIARELKVSQREVERYLQLCHQGGHDDAEA